VDNCCQVHLNCARGLDEAIVFLLWCNCMHLMVYGIHNKYVLVTLTIYCMDLSISSLSWRYFNLCALKIKDYLDDMMQIIFSKVIIMEAWFDNFPKRLKYCFLEINV